MRLFDEVGLSLAPTFVAFTPWITLDGYLDLLNVIAELGLIRSVAPVQLTIRLLIPPGSRLLELPEVRALVGALDEAALVYPWSNPSPKVDRLHMQVRTLVQQALLSRLIRSSAKYGELLMNSPGILSQPCLQRALRSHRLSSANLGIAARNRPRSSSPFNPSVA